MNHDTTSSLAIHQSDLAQQANLLSQPNDIQVTYCAISGLPLGSLISYFKTSPKLSLAKHPIYQRSWNMIARLEVKELAFYKGKLPHTRRLLISTAYILSALGNKVSLGAPLLLSPKETYLYYDSLIKLAYKIKYLSKEDKLAFLINCPSFASSAVITASPISQPTEYRSQVANHVSSFLNYLREQVSPLLDTYEINFSTELTYSQASQLLADRLSGSAKLAPNIADHWHFILNEIADTYQLGENWIAEATAEIKQPSSTTFLSELATFMQGMINSGLSNLSLVSPAIYTEAAKLVKECELTINLSTPNLLNFNAPTKTKTDKVNVEFSLIAPANQPKEESQAAKNIRLLNERKAARLAAAKAKIEELASARSKAESQHKS